MSQDFKVQWSNILLLIISKTFKQDLDLLVHIVQKYFLLDNLFLHNTMLVFQSLHSSFE